MVTVYGPEGHTGIDFKTTYTNMYIFSRVVNWIMRKVTDKRGHISIVCAHDGYLSIGFNDNQREGVYMKVRSNEFQTKDGWEQYETLYFHLDSVRVWENDDRKTSYEEMYGDNFVKAGTILGYGGNSGRYTTGPHLHFELRVRARNGIKNWGPWKKIDPMPLFKDDAVYQKYSGPAGSRYFYKGKEISNTKAKNI